MGFEKPGIALSCGLPPGPDFADLAVLAEQLGYARVWIYDSAPLWEDPFVHLALAATRTTRIGLGTAVLIPQQRSVMAMASAVATLARISEGRFLACFGTGFTARLTVGQRPMTLDALAAYVTALRGLLAGQTTVVDGKPVRMLHADGLAAARPVEVPLWLSVFGPRGSAMAADLADGVIGPPHPTLPAATIMSGTVLDPGEEPGSARVREAVGPWRVVDWHNAYARGGAEAVDAMPGGRVWREALEALAPEGERHLLTFEGHVTHLPDRDRGLLDHIDTRMMIGDAARVAKTLARLGSAGFSEVVYTPSGPDVARELTAFMAARPARLTPAV
ncbi:LLM class flavin-dependent oxidoreductase [Frankia sp. CNm7]|uniref:LLM class flavin-dependent oxidoreductase n=1 Tax=Frankia nepalensis TaxID=1836974 RepID=A0A937UU60_9ACTN|nr:LLM class flavin-dependent oxidoreductase [Frankia nepalensis]MBL7501492.1 LLM class flavin-dependent oxidoreductase [Frankia nepalensis]MBL7513620.1 LLM class flavin-dependent oxidoreductase [Frankia nepalensis]MBL7523841.1 LLM class flavin-dependent oxidoreductase [Frankia nepalensis]MBL7633763.1 LLM class flavin-dependent oxidoreductase [Frankia nepalensis]